jgi:hypothetical protein
MFYLIQSWQSDPLRKYEHTGQTLSQHATLAEAYAALDAYYDRLHSLGLPLTYLELYVVGEDNHPVSRPGTH